MFPATAAEPPQSLEIDNPPMHITTGGAHGTWNGTPATTGEDGYAGEFVITSGGIRYSWATMADIDDYDFAEVSYTAAENVQNIVYKHYNNSDDYADHTGSITVGGDPITFVIKGTTSGGFGIQKWQAGTNPTEITITKITFKQGTRHNVTINADGGTGAPTSITVVEETRAGIWLPAAPIKEGFNFGGWYKGEDLVADSDTIDDSFNNATLTAHWTQAAAVVPTINANLSGTTARGGATVTGATATSYTITYATTGSDNNYGNVYAWFDVTFETGVTLADYGKVSFTYKGETGDIANKEIILMAGTTSELGASNYIGTASNLSLGTVNPNANVNGTTATDKTLTIGARGATISGQTVRFAFYIHASNTSSGTATSYTISNVVFSKE